jgi:hypothetical protein
VTIAMELVTQPAILLLDEPTSGLDSFTAIQLMRTLKQVASDGRIVLLSYHQPSPAMFSLLDRAYLMGQGHCLFAGPPAAAEDWFASQGLPCPVGTAIAEHMLDVVSNPGSLQQLLAVRSKGQLPVSPAAAIAAGEANGLLPPGQQPNGNSAKLEGSGPGSSSSENGGEAGARSSPDRAAASSRGKDGDSSGGGGRQVQHSRRSLSRELAVVFWRTLVDILRNPALLLLHWWGWAGLVGSLLLLLSSSDSSRCSAGCYHCCLSSAV